MSYHTVISIAAGIIFLAICYVIGLAVAAIFSNHKPKDNDE